MANHRPAGWPSVIPRIFCADAPGLVEFIKAVVDASGAVMRGAATIEAPLVTPYGDRRATVQDPWDNVWQIATRLAG